MPESGQESIAASWPAISRVRDSFPTISETSKTAPAIWVLQSRPVAQIYRAATAFKAGGVGRYSRSNFMYMDCCPARSWDA